MNGNGDHVEKMVPYRDAYLLKQCGISKRVMAIETVQEGGLYFDASVQEETRRHCRSLQNIKETGITPREKTNNTINGKEFL